MLITFIIYSPKLFHTSYSIDTERMIADPNGTLSWWLSLNRFGLVFKKNTSIWSKYLSGIHKLGNIYFTRNNDFSNRLFGI